MGVNNFFFSSVPGIAQRGRFSPFLFSGTQFTSGPVRKGFISRVAILNICPPLDCYSRPFLQIQISQNDGPFIIKKELITTQYTNDAAIDFIID